MIRGRSVSGGGVLFVFVFVFVLEMAIGRPLCASDRIHWIIKFSGLFFKGIKIEQYWRAKQLKSVGAEYDL